jgi:dsDNA-specific endonuclease/ATPase MutS2
MPGLAEIGMTSRGPWERSDELSASSGMPTPFRVHNAFPVHDIEMGEELCHAALERQRYSQSREFFHFQSIDSMMTIVEVVLDEANLLDASLCVDRPQTLREIERLRKEIERVESLKPGDIWTQAQKVPELQKELGSLQTEKRTLESSLHGAQLLNDNSQAHLKIAHTEIANLKKDLLAQEQTMRLFLQQRQRELDALKPTS